ncbi:MAG: Peptidyl-prolyl cis-trans isomerase cyp6 [Watsoniomyces obsoletus]|nr:MAG: Peptidyl-prolyl cis-trans isomerase cyp6 [Watsoniomyces obsoletus]
MPSSIPGSVRSSPRSAYLVGRPRSRISPSEETTSDSGGNNQRRRIAVAVHSVACPSSAYPYSGDSLGSSSGGPPPPGGDCATYVSSPAASNGMLGMMTVPGSLQYTRSPPTPGYPLLATKGGSSTGFATSYADDSHGVYSSISPQAMLPGPDPLGNVGLMSPQDSVRGWGPLGPTKSVYMDSGPGAYPTNQYPLTHAGAGSRLPVSTTADSSSLFPGLHALSSSLPLPAPTTAERVLPRPRQPPMGSASGGGHLNENLSYGGWENVPAKPSSQDWGFDSRMLSGGDQDSRRTSSGSSSTLLGAGGSRTGLGANHDGSMNYMSMSTHSASQDLGPAGMSYSSNTNPGMSQVTYAGSDVSSLSATSSSDPSLGSPSSADLYSYTTGNTYRPSGSHGSRGNTAGANEGTLVSGQTYRQLQHQTSATTTTTQSNPLVSLRRDSRDVRGQKAPLSSFRA